MTAISRPPIVPLIADNGADLFASFGVSGSSLSVASVIGYVSATMTPVVALNDPGTPFLSLPLSMFSYIPSGDLVIGRAGIFPQTGNQQPSTAGVHRHDGRKVSPGNLTGVTGFVAPYFNGRGLTTGAMKTVDPVTRIPVASDVTFGTAAGFTVATPICASSSRLGDVAGCVVTAGGPPANYLLACWNPNGAVGWTVPLSVTAPSQSIVPYQIEFGPNGANIYVSTHMASSAGGWVGPWGSLRQYSAANGALNWEVPFTIGASFSGWAPFWIDASETIYVSRPFGTTGGGAVGPGAEAYNSSGILLWSKNLLSNPTATIPSFHVGGGICVIGGTVYCGMPASGLGTIPNADVVTLAAATGTIESHFSIGTISPADYPVWLETRAGRVGTFVP